MVEYYWNAIKGAKRSKWLTARMREEGFERFDEVIDEFRDRFDSNVSKKAARGKIPTERLPPRIIA